MELFLTILYLKRKTQPFLSVRTAAVFYTSLIGLWLIAVLLFPFWDLSVAKDLLLYGFRCLINGVADGLYFSRNTGDQCVAAGSHNAGGYCHGVAPLIAHGKTGIIIGRIDS